MITSSKHVFQSWPLWKLIGSVFLGTIIIIMFLSGWLVRKFESSYLLDILHQHSQQTITLFSTASLEAVITEDSPLLQTLIEQSAKNDPYILSISIENEEGISLAQWQSVEIQSSSPSMVLSNDIMFEKEQFGKITIIWNVMKTHRNIEEHVKNARLFVSGILFLFMIIVIFWVHRLAIFPIQMIYQHLQKLIKGNTSSNLIPSGSIELVHLIKGVNILAKLLHLKKIRQEELEIIVEKRTHELQITKDYTENIILSMADTLIVINPDTTIHTVNQATLNILGYQEHELIGNSISILLEKESHLLEKEGLEELIEKNIIIGVEITYLSKDNKHIPMLFTGSVMRNAIGKIQGIVCVAQDITERKQMEVKLVQSNKLASIGEIAAGLAHELNQPLGVIRIRTDIANTVLKSDQEVDKATLMYNLSEISCEIDRASKIITHLKIFSRQGNTGNHEATDINWLIDESLVLQIETLKMAGINLKKKLTMDLPKVHCDYIQIEQVLTNLIINARDALQDSYEKQILVHSYQQDKSICVDVIDTGCGIPEQIIDKVFDPFFTTKPVGSGTGLGMSISHGIIQGHNGSLLVNSKEGKGSTFTLSLPLEISTLENDNSCIEWNPSL